MSKERITLTDNSRNQPYEAKVFQGTFKKRGKEYVCYRVQGWKENGKWQKKQFSKEKDAIECARTKNIELLNHGRKMLLVATELDEDQTRQAERAFKTLGNAYSLDEAIDFFLKHNRAPDYTISILDGLEIYVADKKKSGVRMTTTKATKLILTSFANKYDNPLVHTITEEQIKTYLNGLRSNDDDPDREGEKLPAKRKTYNNHRNELASFFIWAGKRELLTNRPWTFNNPLEHIPAFSNKRVAEQRPEIATTAPEVAKKLFTYIMGYKKGQLVKYFALAYFAGIRPSTDDGEMPKLAAREDELMNLNTGVITLPADVAKNKNKRQVMISDNLKLWLKAYEGLPIMPKNFKNDYRHVRQKFELQNDETRHSFISHHVALNRSIGDTALQAGNSEGMVKKHYLNHHLVGEGKAFFSIVPDLDAGKAVFSEDLLATSTSDQFKVV